MAIQTRKGGKLYRYYVSQTVLKHGAGSCPVGRVPAGEIKTAVIDQLRAVFRQPEIVAGTWKAGRARDSEITETETREALQQLDPLWDELFAELAEREEISPSYMTRVLRLTLFAPDIVEAILDGRQGPGLTLARLLEPFPVEWSAQQNCRKQKESVGSES
ncbi:hypothetical protein [Minwuia sp. IMCC3077]|uniref:hypothetical protein n=1 Tax=Minwuia sp. IMCC3077 TaxID=3040676 RepID=UPI0024789438|nr:hypothetical protein [Minwuia sp. IMCC3077]